MSITITVTLAQCDVTPLRAKEIIREAFPIPRDLGVFITDISNEVDDNEISFTVLVQDGIRPEQAAWLDAQDFVAPGWSYHTETTDQLTLIGTLANQLTLNGPQARTIGRWHDSRLPYSGQNRKGKTNQSCKRHNKKSY